jgi:hypothetical protein
MLFLTMLVVSSVKESAGTAASSTATVTILPGLVSGR